MIPQNHTLCTRARTNHLLRSSLALISTVKGQSTGSISAFNIAVPNVQLNDLIVITHQYTTSQSTWILGCSDDSNNTYINDFSVYGGGGAMDIRTAHAVASVASANLNVSVAFSGHNITGTAIVYQLRGANAAISWSGQTYTALQPAGSIITSQPYSVSTGSIPIIAAAVYISSGNPAVSVSAPQPLVSDGYNAGLTTNIDQEGYHYIASSAASNQSVNFSATPSNLGWRLSYILGVINSA